MIPANDRIVRCVKCGGPIGCGCYIKIVCPKCKREVPFAERDENDPPNAVSMELTCPECNPGDFEQVFYFDKGGNEIRWDPAKQEALK